MDDIIRFEAQIKEAGGGGAYVEIPFSVKDVFGSGGIIKVYATFDDFPYRGALSPMLKTKHIIGIRKDIRDKIQKQPGDFICVTLKKDTDAREVEIPEDLLEALNSVPGAAEAFNKMSFTNKKEYVNSINDAKKPETRIKRINSTLESVLKKLSK